jgi:hypothetical protein
MIEQGLTFQKEYGNCLSKVFQGENELCARAINGMALFLFNKSSKARLLGTEEGSDTNYN